MNRPLYWVMSLMLLGGLVWVAGVVLRQRADAGWEMPPFSVYSNGQDGLGELGQLLAGLGWEPVALTWPAPRPTDRGLLVVAEPRGAGWLPGAEAIPEGEALALLDWVGRGNTLLVAGRFSTGLHKALRVSVEPAPGAGDNHFYPVDLASAGGYTEGIRRLTVGTKSTVNAGGRGLVLWRVEGKPGAVVLRHGEGRVLLLADAELLTLYGLQRSDGEPRGDNVRFLPNVAALTARDGRVFFDEYYHGVRSGGFWSYLGYHGRRWAVLPVLVVLAVTGWAWAVRLGPAVPLPREGVRGRADAVDYASALATIYRRAGARRLLTRTLTRGFLDAVTRHLHLRRTTMPALILSAWRQQGPPEASTVELQRLLRGVSDLRKGEVEDRELLAWARAFDAWAVRWLGR
jgi:hypothetical protein